MASAISVSMVTAGLPRYITILCNDNIRDLHKLPGDRYLAIEMHESVPYLTFREEEITRLAAHEVVYVDSDQAAMKGVVMIRAPNGRFWERVQGDAYIRASCETRPSAADKHCLFRIYRVLCSQSSSPVMSFQSLLDNLYLKRFSYSILHAFHASTTIADDRFAQVVVQDATASAVALPHYISLRGDNERYLGYNDARSQLRFDNPTPQFDVAHEVIHLPDANLMIRNIKGNKFWRVTDPPLCGIVADQPNLSNAQENKLCHFDVIQLNNNQIALRSIKNGRFLARQSSNQVCASGETIHDIGTHLVINEALQMRTLLNIKYLHHLAKVYDIATVVVGSGSMCNKTTLTIPLKVPVNVAREVFTSEMWSIPRLCTFSTSVPVSFNAGVPLVISEHGTLNFSPKVMIGSPEELSTELGRTIRKKMEFQTIYEIGNVPPGVEVNVTMHCTIAKCYVPFICTSKDTRLDGVQETEIFDGIFEGINVVDIKAIIAQVTSTRV